MCPLLLGRYLLVCLAAVCLGRLLSELLPREPDVFAQPVKGKKGKQQPAAAKTVDPDPADAGDEDEAEEGGRMKTKAPQRWAETSER